MLLNSNAVPSAWYAPGNSRVAVGYGHRSIAQWLLRAAPYQLDQFGNFFRCGEGDLGVDQ